MSADDDAGELIAVAVTRIDEADFVRAYEEIPALRNLRWSVLIVPAVMGVLLVTAGAFSMSVPYAASMAGGTLLLIAWLFFMRRGLPARQWRAIPEHLRQARYEVRRHRFRTRSERSSVDIAYEDFFGFVESAHAFYLEQHASHFLIVPKSAFESADEIDAAREVFATKMTARPRKRVLLPRLVKVVLLWLLLIAMFVAIYALVTDR